MASEYITVEGCLPKSFEFLEGNKFSITQRLTPHNHPQPLRKRSGIDLAKIFPQPRRAPYECAIGQLFRHRSEIVLGKFAVLEGAGDFKGELFDRVELRFLEKMVSIGFQASAPVINEG